ncbi:MAG: YggT family protein [Anaerolineales bacterium]
MAREKMVRETQVVESDRRATQDRQFRQKELAKRQIVLRKATNFVWWFTGIVEGLIGLRVVLRMLAANPGNPFADFIYALSGAFLWPFQTLVNNPSSEGGVVLEVTSIIAMIVYLLLAWVFVELLWLILGRERA